MNRNELKQVAHGLKATKPHLSPNATSVTEKNDFRVELSQWEKTVTSVADSLSLVDKPRSNFLAACGYHIGQEVAS